MGPCQCYPSIVDLFPSQFLLLLHYVLNHWVFHIIHLYHGCTTADVESVGHCIIVLWGAFCLTCRQNTESCSLVHIFFSMHNLNSNGGITLYAPLVALNLTKYCCALYHWCPNKDSILHPSCLDPADSLIQVDLLVSSQTIPMLTLHEGTCYLSIYITHSGTMKPMEDHVWSKAILYTCAFQCTYDTKRSYCPIPFVLLTSAEMFFSSNMDASNLFQTYSLPFHLYNP